MRCLCRWVLSAERMVGWDPRQGLEHQNLEGPQGSALIVQSPLTAESAEVPKSKIYLRSPNQ